MEIRHLQALVAVAEHGSFSAAADALATVQSNISAHIGRLERELRCTLVARTGGRLTGEGEVVVARAYRILAEVDACLADVGALRAEIAGTVRVGTIGTTARWLVPRLLHAIRASHPKLRLLIAEGTTATLEPQLAAGRLDVAVLTPPGPGPEVRMEPLFEEALLLVVGAEHPAAALLPTTGPLPLERLAEFELLLPAPGTPFRTELERAVRPRGVVLHPRAELDGVRLIATLTFEGWGPAILPASAVPTHLRDAMRLVPVADLPHRRVGIALRARGLPSAATQLVVQTLRRVSAEAPVPPGIRPIPPEAVAGAEGAVRAVHVPNG